MLAFMLSGSFTTRPAMLFRTMAPVSDALQTLSFIIKVIILMHTATFVFRRAVSTWDRKGAS